jgi:hypothetical protein
VQSAGEGYSYETSRQLGTLDAKCAEEPALDVPMWSECYQ